MRDVMRAVGEDRFVERIRALGGKLRRVEVERRDADARADRAADRAIRRRRLGRRLLHEFCRRDRRRCTVRRDS